YGCIYRYCFSDSGTTLAMGELTAELSRRFAALRVCMDAGEEAMRPGAKASTVAGAMVEALHERGITASFPHGHGVGLEVRDYPVLVPDNGLRVKDDCVDQPSDLTLEADMVLNLEAPLFMPGVGSLHSEQSYVVTPQGSRPLLDQQRERPVLIGQ
ncbi:MAG: M24 family metallopeptidase, partial [Caldilineaceae bacterium]|nr:M24 family metallopeptidase [Caldilineaceae bacterium]